MSGKKSQRPEGAYVSVSFLADRWGISAPTVIRMIAAGELTGLRVRGQYRITLASITAYEKQRKL